MREPPHNLDAERYVLGAVFTDPKRFPEIAAEVATEDFYSPTHQAVWQAMGAVAGKRRPPELIAVQDEMATAGERPDPSYLLDLLSACTTVENVGHYTAIIRDKAAGRRLASLCAQTLSRIGSGDHGEMADDLARDVTSLITRSACDIRPVSEILGAWVQDVENRAQNAANGAARVTGVPLGIELVDESTLGLQPGWLSVIAARTGGGKTCLALQAALNCVRAGGSALYFNLEMREVEMLERAFCHLAPINSALVRQGNLQKGDWEKVYKHANQTWKWKKLYVVDNVFNMREIAALMRRWRARHSDVPGIVIVDFLQLVRGSGKGDRRVEMGDHAQQLKELAKALGVTVIAVSQLNRKSAAQGGNDEAEPTVYELKESGDIENASDFICLIHNPTKTEDGHVTLIVGKNRNGPTGKYGAHWIGRWYRFNNPEPLYGEDHAA